MQQLQGQLQLKQPRGIIERRQVQYQLAPHLLDTHPPVILELVPGHNEIVTHQTVTGHNFLIFEDSNDQGGSNVTGAEQTLYAHSILVYVYS